ncbi:hypothetical protein Tco_0654928 [Tanacetum coccineum]|uniref:Uncharacterized protein n=1 Tax=Tanacetum coccineum TaxID=301880 RepID=A0ABQ4X4Q2_9ASTR
MRGEVVSRRGSRRRGVEAMEGRSLGKGAKGGVVRGDGRGWERECCCPNKRKWSRIVATGRGGRMEERALGERGMVKRDRIGEGGEWSGGRRWREEEVGTGGEDANGGEGRERDGGWSGGEGRGKGVGEARSTRGGAVSARGTGGWEGRSGGSGEEGCGADGWSWGGRPGWGSSGTHDVGGEVGATVGDIYSRKMRGGMMGAGKGEGRGCEGWRGIYGIGLSDGWSEEVGTGGEGRSGGIRGRAGEGPDGIEEAWRCEGRDGKGWQRGWAPGELDYGVLGVVNPKERGVWVVLATLRGVGPVEYEVWEGVGSGGGMDKLVGRGRAGDWGLEFDRVGMVKNGGGIKVGVRGQYSWGVEGRGGELVGAALGGGCGIRAGEGGSYAGRGRGFGSGKGVGEQGSGVRGRREMEGGWVGWEVWEGLGGWKGYVVGVVMVETGVRGERRGVEWRLKGRRGGEEGGGGEGGGDIGLDVWMVGGAKGARKGGAGMRRGNDQGGRGVGGGGGGVRGISGRGGLVDYEGVAWWLGEAVYGRRGRGISEAWRRDWAYGGVEGEEAGAGDKDEGDRGFGAVKGYRVYNKRTVDSVNHPSQIYLIEFKEMMDDVELGNSDHSNDTVKDLLSSMLVPKSCSLQQEKTDTSRTRAVRITMLIADIEDDIMDPVMQCTTLPSHSGFSQKKLVSFVMEIHTTSIDFLTPSYSQDVDKSPTHYPCDSARTFRVILFSIHNDEWKSFQCHHQTALRRPYALSWKPCQGDSLNLPDHRIHKDGDGDASFQLKSDSLPHAHAQTTKTFYKHQDSRIMKAQELKTKTSAQTLIYKIFLQRYQVYQGRLLASFQDDAKYEHVGQDTRSQDPLKLWKSYWRRMSDDIPRTVLDSLHIEDLYMNDPELEGGVLCELEVILNTFSKTVSDYSLHPLLKKHRDTLRNRELMEEKSYNRVELAKEVAVLLPKLNTKQRNIYDMVLGAATANQ